MSVAFLMAHRATGGGSNEIPALSWFLFLVGLDGWLIYFYLLKGI